jgi:ABC-type transport system involved in multi-copper enzyme maturation permease subunit
MNPVFSKNLRLIKMQRVYLVLLLIPFYFALCHHSDLLKGVVYIFTTVLVFGPIVSSLDAEELKHKTRMVFYSLPVSRRHMVLGEYYTAYGVVGAVIAVIFMASVVMHMCSAQWPIMTLGEVLFIFMIIGFQSLLETWFGDFFYDVNAHRFKLSFAICLFMCMSFFVYPYLIASIVRLDFSWPKGTNPMQLTLDLFNRPLPAMVLCVVLCLILWITIKQRIRYIENKDI